ncbi:hypothetical protein GS4_02_00710 [Gordonia soli NBRC 108243]|uniref:Hemolysin n=1 Tax=Gordonia soli NBRC 108243 TaxID=1223545 RepID=M0QDI1_9ACTN|nr:hypothetical protein GS4_02_00710 [Gordonia soli NBRC 108243]
MALSTDPDDIEAAQRLRYQVFAEEDGFSDQIGDPTTGLDADSFDDHCEHLLVFHEDTGLIGCARLLPPAAAIAAGGWYSATEFDLYELEPIRAETVEMGRACVATAHRDGSVTALMWAALLHYLENADYQYLMGCVSVPLSGAGERGQALRGVRDLARDRHQAPWQAFPLERARIDGRTLDEIEPPAVAVLPPLLRGYIRLGARVCGEPAVDEIFDVGDLLTVVDRTLTDIRYLERLRAAVRRLGGQADR